jgi:hypothetical protein
MIRDRKAAVRTLLLHVALVCSLVVLTAGILDWFNPFMNFSGQIRPLEILQTAALIFLAVTAGWKRKKHRQVLR